MIGNDFFIFIKSRSYDRRNFILYFIKIKDFCKRENNKKIVYR